MICICFVTKNRDSADHLTASIKRLCLINTKVLMVVNDNEAHAMVTGSSVTTKAGRITHVDGASMQSSDARMQTDHSARARIKGEVAEISSGLRGDKFSSLLNVITGCHISSVLTNRWRQSIDQQRALMIVETEPYFEDKICRLVSHVACSPHVPDTPRDTFR